MVRLSRRPAVRMTLSSLFHAVQGGLGLSVTPSHFYFPVPRLKSFDGKDWKAPRSSGAFDYRLGEQIQRLHKEILPFAAEWMFPDHETASKYEFHFNNGFFERVDAEVAYSLVRRYKPKRLIEVGSGNTTLLLAAAMHRNASEGFAGEFTAIEPSPPAYLNSGLPGLTQLMRMRVQEAPFELFRRLAGNDILFIDSSHVVSIDSDVLYECLHILPELAPGVIVHFHDIFAPLDYPEKFVRLNLCFWGEQYLLEAFLSFNFSFKVIWSGSAMQQYHADVLRQAFPGWDGSFSRMPAGLKVFAPSLDAKNVWPCSFWIARTDD